MNLRQRKKRAKRFITIYRGNLSFGPAGSGYDLDIERARMGATDGRYDLITSIFIDTCKIYRKNPLPRAFGHGEGMHPYVDGQKPHNAIDKLWENAKEAVVAGYDAYWVDEGEGQPNSVFVVNKERIN